MRGRYLLVVLASVCLCPEGEWAWAQSSSTEPQTLPPVVVTGTKSGTKTCAKSANEIQFEWCAGRRQRRRTNGAAARRGHRDGEADRQRLHGRCRADQAKRFVECHRFPCKVSARRALQRRRRQSVPTNIEFRGFVASPVSGTPQGLAVYQNGVRINEAFW